MSPRLSLSSPNVVRFADLCGRAGGDVARRCHYCNNLLQSIQHAYASTTVRDINVGHCAHQQSISKIVALVFRSFWWTSLLCRMAVHSTPPADIRSTTSIAFARSTFTPSARPRDRVKCGAFRDVGAAELTTSARRQRSSSLEHTRATDTRRTTSGGGITSSARREIYSSSHARAPRQECWPDAHASSDAACPRVSRAAWR